MPLFYYENSFFNRLNRSGSFSTSQASCESISWAFAK
jgi:hypothetical protein